MLKLLKRFKCKHEHVSYYRTYLDKVLDGRYAVREEGICNDCGKVVYSRTNYIGGRYL